MFHYLYGNKAFYSAAILNGLLDYCKEIEYLQAKCYYGNFVLINERVICAAVRVKNYKQPYKGYCFALVVD